MSPPAPTRRHRPQPPTYTNQPTASQSLLSHLLKCALISRLSVCVESSQLYPSDYERFNHAWSSGRSACLLLSHFHHGGLLIFWFIDFLALCMLGIRYCIAESRALSQAFLLSHSLFFSKGLYPSFARSAVLFPVSFTSWTVPPHFLTLILATHYHGGQEKKSAIFGHDTGL